MEKPIPKPKISIIVPVYNTQQYLRQCLQSIVNQTLQEIEIIVVNDASPDNSQAIIDEFAAKDARIISIIHSENKRQGAARNTGMQHAKADVIGFIDSDDYIENSMYEDMYNMLIAHNLDMVQCSIARIGPNGSNSIYFQATRKNGIILRESLIDALFEISEIDFPIRWSACNKIFVKDIIIHNKIEFPVGIIAEDIPFTIKYLSSINSVGNLPGDYYKYRLNLSSTMNKDTNIAYIDSFNFIYMNFQDFFIDKKKFKSDYLFAFFHEYCNALYHIWNRFPDDKKIEHSQLFIDSVYQKIPQLLAHNQLDPNAMKFILQPIEFLNNRWCRFGLLSRKRKIWAIAKFFSKKLGLYKLLRSIATPIATKFKHYLEK